MKPNTAEKELQATLRAQTRAAVERFHAQAESAGVDRLGPEAIKAEIAAARRARQKER